MEDTANNSGRKFSDSLSIALGGIVQLGAGIASISSGFKAAFDSGASAGERFAGILSILIGSTTLLNGLTTLHNTLKLKQVAIDKL